MAKHTPAPWSHDPKEYGFMTFNGPGSESIVGGCGCCCSPFGVSDDAGHSYYKPCPTDYANARLIAAAPDLLEALEAYILQHENLLTGQCGDQLLMARAEQAIAKATGAAP